MNKELVGLYWDIGQLIVARQEGKSWGKAVVKRLATDLQAEFPGVGGFSTSNLWRMRSFFEDFLRAMGGMLAFVGSQFRLEVEGEEYFIDLLLFHRRLRCLVAIELKVGKFEPEFVGKMQFYLTALDRQVREEEENPSIGIILCKEKKRTIVEYALQPANKPIGVATYEIVKRLPKELKGQLPGPEEIARLLDEEG